jgi:hypothetical protein
VAQSVAAPNSLYGSMSLNGMGVILALRQKVPAMVVTETHPKVIYFATSGKKYDWDGARSAMTAWLGDQLGRAALATSTDHEFDAALSAWACAQGVMGLWKRDLHAPIPGHLIGGSSIRPAGATRYFWP